ncbi:MAG TPA: ChbG/HpnK family deacetylase [Candidatus Limnocylindrales bacterium]|nr:ChbG/HpnK family deacetylase [Candidatus Limnocylindrales bacterium]
MRRLIVNADDFGLTSGVNDAISHANQQGVVTSATIMANSRAFTEAVMIAGNQAALHTGCHVVLIDGIPIVSSHKSVVAQGGAFRSSLREFAAAAVRQRIDPAEIEREAEAQIAKIQSSGLTVTHVDSHKHTHMFPHVLRPVLRAARTRGVRAVRNPFEPRRAWTGRIIMAAPGLWLRSCAVMVFNMFAAEFYRAVKAVGMVTTDGTVGIAVTGRLDQRILLAILRALPEGTWELVCHPGYSDADLQAAGTRLLKSREIELSALTSEETKHELERQKIELISYADLLDL